MNWTPFIILIIYFAGMFVIGVLANRKSKTVSDYYVAGRSLPGVLVALVYMSSLVSAGALVGWTGQASSYGVWFIFAGCAVTIATYLCWRFLSGKVMRLSKKMDMLTVPDFLEARFNSKGGTPHCGPYPADLYDPADGFAVQGGRSAAGERDGYLV